MAKRLPPLNSSAGAQAKTLTRLSDLRPDPKNANEHTERGFGLLEHSLRRYGAGRSILVDRHGVTIAGAATLEKAAELGLEIEVVRSRGEKLIVHQRLDLDMSEEGNADARELAISDNRTSEISLCWSAEVLQGLQAEDTDLTAFFTDDELADLAHRPRTPKPERVEFSAAQKVCACCKSKCKSGCECYTA